MLKLFYITIDDVKRDLELTFSEGHYDFDEEDRIRSMYEIASSWEIFVRKYSTFRESDKSSSLISNGRKNFAHLQCE